MDRVLFLFGLLMFLFSFIFFVMNFFGNYDRTTMIVSVFGKLNSGIAMGVAEILSKIKKLN